MSILLVFGPIKNKKIFYKLQMKFKMNVPRIKENPDEQDR